MIDNEVIKTYYINARELVKLDRPKEARKYLLVILNAANDRYKQETDFIKKARTAAFLSKWIPVSRDLYEKGVTDYVKECFGLIVRIPKTPTKPEVVVGGVEPSSPVRPYAPVHRQTPPMFELGGDEPDISGLIGEAEGSQGWCAEIFDKYKHAALEVHTSYGGQGWTGTGFIISENGYFLTNDHVVFDDDSGCYCDGLRIAQFGSDKLCKFELILSDKAHDVALCKFDPDKLKDFAVVKRIADYSTLKQGAECLIIGNAFGLGLAPISGLVRFTKDDEDDLVYSAPSNPGDSGGAVFAKTGECIGIKKSHTNTINGEVARGYSNATPMDEIDKLLDKWTKHNNIEL